MISQSTNVLFDKYHIVKTSSFTGINLFLNNHKDDSFVQSYKELSAGHNDSTCFFIFILLINVFFRKICDLQLTKFLNLAI